jgi:MoaA/NifB/PqqE/SkfB family radical SAM enzyme
MATTKIFENANLSTLQVSENSTLNRQELSQKLLRLNSRPRHGWLAITNQCNHLCIHCSLGHAEYRKQPVIEMPLSVWERLEDELFPYMESVIFGGNNLGEQMVASCWDTYFDRLMKFPLRPEFITNGTLFNDERVEKTVAKECEIRFSIEAAKKETFEKIRGKSYDLVMNNIKKLHQEKQRHPGNKTVLVFGVTIFRDNIEELPLMVDLATDLGIERMEVHHLHPSFQEHRYQSLIYHRSLCNQKLQEARERALKLGIWFLGPMDFPMEPMQRVSNKLKSQKQKSELPDRCILPWSWVSINESGEVMPCCAMPLVMGNLKRQSFMTVWNNYKYRHLRRTVNSNRPVGICRHCHDRLDEDLYEQTSRVDDFSLLQKIGTDDNLTFGKWTLMMKYAMRNYLRQRKGGEKIIRFLTPIVRRFSL